MAMINCHRSSQFGRMFVSKKGVQGTMYRFYLIVIMSVGYGLAGLTGLAVASIPAVSCGSVDCHADIVDGPVVHSPVAEGECESCHQAGEGSHPGESSFTLMEEGPALCLSCHDDPVAGMAVIHPAL